MSWCTANPSDARSPGEPKEGDRCPWTSGDHAWEAEQCLPPATGEGVHQGSCGEGMALHPASLPKEEPLGVRTCVTMAGAFERHFMYVGVSAAYMCAHREHLWCSQRSEDGTGRSRMVFTAGRALHVGSQPGLSLNC